MKTMSKFKRMMMDSRPRILLKINNSNNFIKITIMMTTFNPNPLHTKTNR